MKSRLALATVTAATLAACSALDTADQAWQAAVEARQSCYDNPTTAAEFPSAAAYVATGQCDSAFATALEAITWPNDQLSGEALTLENDAMSSAATEATGGFPSIAQTDAYASAKLVLDDDLANQVLSEGGS
jgi:hypothetical protein